MLTIYSPTKYHKEISSIISREDRLDELIHIVDYLEERPVPNAHNLVVRDDAIYPLIDWYNIMPPYLLAEKHDFTPEYLLAILFARLNNYERVYHYLADFDPAFNQELDIYNRLQYGLTIDPGDLVSSLDHFDEYRLMHNHAVVRHYSSETQDHEQTKYYYLQALELAPSGDLRAFTARHFGMLLIDSQEIDDAIRVLKVGLASAESEEGKTALRHALCQARMQTLGVPYDDNSLSIIKSDLWSVLQSYKKQDRYIDTALALMDAATICYYEESWSEGLGYLSQAIELLSSQEAPALLADAYLRKGTLLFSWAHKGNPQFYRKAAEALQVAAKTFTREDAPLIFADIQQRLGLIYAEMPDEDKKKGLWAAISSTAFQDALAILNKDEYPQQYATVCNHYGNALIKYPEAKLTDNVEKAIYLYQEALNLRSAETMPLERSLTLLNYIEGQWYLSMPEDVYDEERVIDMEAKAKEIMAISPDPKLVEEAQKQLEKIELLKSAYA